MNTIEKRETQIIRAIVIWIPILLLLLSPMRAKAQQSAGELAKWHPTQNLIAVTDAFTIELYNSDFVLLDQIEVVSNPTLQIRSGGMEWSPDGSKLALVVVGVDFDPTGSALLIWDMTNFQLLTQIPSVLPAFTPMAWNPAGTRLAAIHSPGFAQDVVRIYDATSGVLLSEFSHSSTRRNITQIAWSPDGNQIAFEEQGEVHIWNAETAQSIITLSNDVDNEVELVYSPTTNHLAYVDISNSSNILIWDTIVVHPR